MTRARKLARIEALERKIGATKPLLVVFQDLTDRSEYHTKPRSKWQAGDDREYSESDLEALAERYTLLKVVWQDTPISNSDALRGASAR